jgi:hypothetical protein
MATKKTDQTDDKTVDQQTTNPDPEPTPDAAALASLVEELSGGNRRRRQEASHVIATVAKTAPDELLPHMGDLVDALYRPEAQTRWEILDALSEVATMHSDAVAEAYDAAEASLFDEGSSTVRLASFRFLARYGTVSPENSDKVWPLLDEAIQCFHGDLEYRDMLVSMLEFVQGDISDQSKAELLDRIRFDSESGRGYIKTGSVEITEAAKKTKKTAAKPKKAATKAKPAAKAAPKSKGDK